MALQPCKATPYLDVCVRTEHTQTHTQPPSHLALLPYTQSSQAYQVCLCCCCRANEQCTKTKGQAKLLLSDPLWVEGRKRERQREGKRQRHRGGSPMLVYALRFIHTAMWETGAGFYAWINTHNGMCVLSNPTLSPMAPIWRCFILVAHYKLTR